MPVILRVRGFKFFFYQADVANEPPHVHMTKEGMKRNSGSTLSGLHVQGDSEKVTCVTLNALSKITYSFS
jgi:hypothetical protein